jgi:hypothetical protein
MCWFLIGGLTLGLGSQGCLGRSSRGTYFRKFTYRGKQKKAEWVAGNLLAEDKGKVGMGGYLHMVPFILALDSFCGLTGNFSRLITCFEAISYS